MPHRDWLQNYILKFYCAIQPLIFAPRPVASAEGFRYICNMSKTDTEMNASEEMQRIKRLFFSLRNGVIADTLRLSGLGYKIAFGLELPQLIRIAKETGESLTLARELWKDCSVRESMLLAPMLCPAGEFSRAEALEWASQVPTVEVADILCHKLLRHLAFAGELAEELIKSPKDMERYLALRLALNLLPGFAKEAMEFASGEASKECLLTRGICQRIVDEVGLLGFNG